MKSYATDPRLRHPPSVMGEMLSCHDTRGEPLPLHRQTWTSKGKSPKPSGLAIESARASLPADPDIYYNIRPRSHPG